MIIDQDKTIMHDENGVFGRGEHWLFNMAQARRLAQCQRY
jgi:hypothetical protein